MSLTQADLDRRIRAASRDDTVRGLVFNAAFDLVRRVAGEDAARACDPEHVSHRLGFHSFLVEDFLRVAFAAARALAPSYGGADGALGAIGACVWGEVSRSVAGRTLMSLSAGDPRLFVDRIASGYRTVVSWGERTVAWEGERRARLRFERDFLDAPFHAGVLSAAMAATEAQRPQVNGRDAGFLAVELELSWS
jgi:uncharacterized protein (TIGR02265 family)